MPRNMPRKMLSIAGFGERVWGLLALWLQRFATRTHSSGNFSRFEAPCKERAGFTPRIIRRVAFGAQVVSGVVGGETGGLSGSCYLPKPVSGRVSIGLFGS